MSDTMLAETADRLFGDVVTQARLAAAETGGMDRAAWASVAEAGLPLALLPEEAGGFGVAPAEALGLLRVAGRHALPLPLAETMLAGWLLAGAGVAVPEGVLTVAVGPSLDRGRVSGTAWGVAWGGDADQVVVLAESGGRPVLALARPSAVEAGRNIAREPRDTLHFDAAAEIVEAPVGLAGWRAAGAASRAILIAGALERITAMTTQYALDRSQFGRPIGRFQAVQHSLAVLAAQTAAAIAAGDNAAEALVPGPNIPAIAAAKARAGEAAGIGAGLAHQIHGAIGFTYEHSLHYFTKRLHAWRDEFGNEEWAVLLGRHLAAAGADALWPTLTGLSA